MWPLSYRSLEVSASPAKRQSHTNMSWSRRRAANSSLEINGTLIAIVGPPCSLAPRQLQAGTAVLVDYLDPAGDLVAGERVGEIRMVASDVTLDLSDHLVIALSPCDEAALAFDLPGHDVVAAIVEAGPFSYL